ncbi:hypothetical protein Tco_0963821 [Tanacetum coccineum]
MDPNSSIGFLCLGEGDRVLLNDIIKSEGDWDAPEYQDTVDSGRKKEVKAFTFYRMETEEVSERLTKRIVDFGSGILTIYPDLITFNDDSDDELDALLASIDLKLDGEFDVEEEIVGEEFINDYKSITEKNDPGVFVLPIRLEGKYDCHASVSTESNINVSPLYLLLDIPVDHDVPIVVGRSFLYSYGAIMNSIKGTTSIFDGIIHQTFYVENVRNAHMESDSDDDEEMIRSHVLRVWQKMITYGLCQRTTRYDKWMKRKGVGTQKESMIWCGQLVTRLAKKIGVLTDEVLNGPSAPIYCRSLDATTLRELIGSNGRMGRMEIRQCGAYAPPGYDEEQ